MAPPGAVDRSASVAPHTVARTPGARPGGAVWSSACEAKRVGAGRLHRARVAPTEGRVTWRRAVLIRLGPDWIAARIALLLAAFLLPGCRGDPRASAGPTVTVAYYSGIEGLSPAMDETAKFLVFLPLVSYDLNHTPHPRLARSWEHSPDYLEWTYHLRTDARWHDGTPVTARDVAFTLRLLSHPAVAYLDRQEIEAVTVRDDSTVTIHSPNWTSHANDAWLVYYPEHLLKDLDPEEFYQWEFWQDPVGNGPYRFVRYVPETMIVFKANPDWYAGEPRIRRVVLKMTKDAALTELLAGRVDAIAEPNPMQIPRLAGDRRYRKYLAVVEHVARAIYWKTDHPLFSDPRVRRALTLALDRREALRVLNLPDTLAVVDGPYTARQYRHQQLLAPWPHDPNRARALLEEAGWKDLDGDGIRERNGRPFRFTAIVHPDPGLAQVAVLLQEHLRRVGVRMEVQPLERGMMEWVRAGDFEAALVVSQHQAWWLNRFFAKGSPLGYDNPEVSRLINRAESEAHPDSVDAAYRELQRIFREDLPATFLGPRTEAYFVHRRIRGLDGWWPDPIENMGYLWVEGETEN